MPANVHDRGGARTRSFAKIENDHIRIAGTDQCEKALLHRIGISR
jgi:hypothetical protein